MKDTEAAFWLVWNPEGLAPTMKHETEVRARTEANRLAHRNPGQQFVVLRATEAVTVGGIQRTTFRDETDIPF